MHLNCSPFDAHVDQCPLPSLQYRAGAHGNWQGNYPDWKGATEAAAGYADNGIFAKVYAAARSVRDGKALWERDSVLFHREEYNRPLLECLSEIAVANDGALHVLDFGGALGSTYVQHKVPLALVPILSWSVVEQRQMVACGQREFADEHLAFFHDTAAALRARPINAALLSSVAQYLDAKLLEDVLSTLALGGVQDIIVDRTPFRHDADRHTVQRPEVIYPGASYAMRLMALPTFDALMHAHGYSLVHTCPALDGAWDDCVFLMLHYRKISVRKREESMAARAAFSTVYFEISSVCNAQCPYCVTGRSTSTGAGKFVNPDLFEAACAKMVRLGILNEQSLLHLYIWGEPTLHPRLSELLERTRNFPFGIALSTNASKVPDITEAFVEKVRTVRFSCSGFSQQSYDRIHGFHFSNVRANMVNFVQHARERGSHAEFTLNFHIYQFNLDEIPAAKKFAQSLGIRFSPNYAILNDWDLSQRWVAGTLNAQEERRIGRELFNDLPAQLLEKAPCDYACPQGQYLVINELGQILICCQTPSEDTFAVGNIMDENALEHIANRQTSPVCSSCVRSGMAYMFNNSLACPAICK